MKFIKFFKTKKLLVFLALLILIFVIFISKHSLVMIALENSSEKTVYISSLNDQSSTLRTYEIKNKKLIVLPKGRYSIKLYDETKSSTYYKTFGGFRYSKIKLELNPQKKSSYLGDTNFTCVYSTKDVRKNIFYSCNGLDQNIEIDENNVKRTIANPNSLDIEDETGINSETNADVNLESITKPLGDGLLSFYFSGPNTLETWFLDQDGTYDTPKKYNNLNISRMNSVNTVTANDDKSSMFSILDNATLYVFDNNANTSKKIDLSKELGQYQVIKLAMSNSKVFVLARDDISNTIEHETQEPTNQQLKDIYKKQHFLEIDSSSEKITKHKLPEGFVFNQSAISSNGNLVITPTNSDLQPIVLKNKKTKPILLDSRDIIELCWKDTDSLIYISGDRKKIFSHSVSKSGSFLVYETSTSTISNLGCQNGKINFSLLSNKDVLGNKQNFFEIIDENFTNSVRLETILPMSYTYKADTYRLFMVGDEIKVSLIYDSDKNGPSSKEDLMTEFERILIEKGVDKSNIKYSFGF